jgi:arsenical pump membrane protein
LQLLSATGFIAAIMLSIMNNMPTVLVAALAIDATVAHGVVLEATVYADVMGDDLAPKITPLGSLAKFMWLHILSAQGIKISWGYYCRVGGLLTVPILLVTLCALALRPSL